MKQNGNVKVNAHYNPDEIRHPPPVNLMDAERDSEMEKYVRGEDQTALCIQLFNSNLISQV